MDILSVEKLGKNFGGDWIFKDLSFALARGETVAVIGPSGAGKSVLLKLLSGLLSPDEGSIQCSAQNLGMLFQKNALFDSLTVKENILFPLKERLGLDGDAAQERAGELLDAVGILPAAELMPHEISGGMQKRLGIARVLSILPDLILYDEPTAGLDPITSRKIAELILDLKEKNGTSLILVTNDLQRAYQIADRIFVLAEGELLYGGTPQEIQATTHPLIRQFIYGLAQGPLTEGVL